MGHFKYTYDGKWIWDEEESTANESYTTTFTTGEPIEIKAPSWKTGDKIEINSPINTAPASYGWICPVCGRVNAPWIGQCSCSGRQNNTFKIDTSPAFVTSPCQTCSNNPANGSSGICHCTLGTPPITC